MVADTLHITPQTVEGMLTFFYFFIAFLFGCAAATAELFSRYSGGPGSTFQFKESYMYLALNGIASLIAYAMIKNLGISFGIFGNSPLSQAVLAGFSSMAVLRSSVASIKRGQNTIQVGLTPVIQVFLDKVDRAFDRKRSQSDLKRVSEIMRNIDFTKAVKDLPTTCLNLMQNVSNEESERLGGEVADLSKTELSPQTKALNLGIAIQRVTGIALLQSAVESLGDAIHMTAQQQDSSGQQQPSTYEVEHIRKLKKKFL